MDNKLHDGLQSCDVLSVIEYRGIKGVFIMGDGFIGVQAILPESRGCSLDDAVSNWHNIIDSMLGPVNG
jgi:hypothetical protein